MVGNAYRVIGLEMTEQQFSEQRFSEQRFSEQRLLGNAQQASESDDQRMPDCSILWSNATKKKSSSPAEHTAFLTIELALNKTA